MARTADITPSVNLLSLELSSVGRASSAPKTMPPETEMKQWTLPFPISVTW